ncbi:unnamed protein product [Phytophthora fragariaefolia]|uniref:Unnamed protein product n=1 Tax=Phytophthora fragariaefolia TaxID=1490495 RepID=A0A9W6YQZ8_9STRA|nr:unnamed protein product [Phytophthora fragariaefolia]
MVSELVNQTSNQPEKCADSQSRVRNTRFSYSRVPKPGQGSTKVGNSAGEPIMMAGLPVRSEMMTRVPTSRNRTTHRPDKCADAQSRVHNTRVSYCRVHKPDQVSTRVGNSAEAVPLMVWSRPAVPEKNETPSGIFAVVGEFLLPQSRVHHSGACTDGDRFDHATKEDKPNDRPEGSRTTEFSWNISDKELLHFAELQTPATTCADPLVARKKMMEFKGIHSQAEFLNSAMDEIRLAEDTQRSVKLADASVVYAEGQKAQRDDASPT